MAKKKTGPARTVVGVDVGTTKVCTLVGEANTDNDLRIVGVGVVPSRGIRKGVVVNVREVTEAIAESIDRAERISGYQVEGAYVGIAGAHISAINSRGVVAVSRGERGIQKSDIKRALESARTMAIPPNREVLHVIPRAYTVDGTDGVRDPSGMQAYHLEAEAHVVTGAASTIHNLIKCVQGANVNVDALILEPLASGEAILSDVEREMGVVVVDIGGGTTDIAVFMEGSIWHTVVLPTGGEHITHDIAVGLRTPLNIAEDIKLQYGHCRPEAVPPDETFEVSSFGENGRQAVSRHFLAQIIEARMAEIFDMVRQEIKRSGYDGLLAAGVVLCGGTADLPGIRDMGREILGMPVRIGAPRDLQGLVEVLGSPAYATSVGLLTWGLRSDEPPPVRPSRNGGLFNLGRVFKVFLPE